MLIVNQEGDIRVNYDNVSAIRMIECKNKNIVYAIYVTLNSGDNIYLYEADSKEKAEKALVALDEAIIQAEAYKNLSISSENEVDDLYQNAYIFYMAECEV